jgi:AraC-like DNA-binding protein
VSTDVLSDVLRTVRLTGGVFFSVRAVRPWIAAAPDGARLATWLKAGAEHLIPYHVVTDGECFAGLVDGKRVHMKAGDVIVLPRGDPHVLSDSPEGNAELEPQKYRGLHKLALPVRVEIGGQGPASAHLVCGFLGCDARPFNPLLDTLPRVIHQSYGAAPESPWLRHFLDVAVAESESQRAGSGAVLSRLSELMFVEIMRRYADSLPPGSPSWLAGLRDPAVAHALTLLHANPARAWTLEEVAEQVAVSRSVLAERFTRLVGLPLMQYLVRWRMQVAAGLLAQGSAKVAEIAADVGYDSEAAFSRAFKRIAGASPAAWRRQRTQAAAR